MGFVKEFAAATISGLVVAGVASLGLYWKAHDIALWAQTQNPTCDAPRGLQPIRDDFGAPSGATIDGSNDLYGPQQVLDNYGGTIWLPRQHSDKKGRQVMFDNAQLSIHLKHVHDVRLVCVNNGLATTYPTYANWGRVRTIKVWSSDEATAELTTLQSLGSDTYANDQYAASGLGDTDVIHIQLLDAYTGTIVNAINPNECSANSGGVLRTTGDGCIRSPTAKAGLSTVTLYEPRP